jgi:hypothetical protein
MVAFNNTFTANVSPQYMNCVIAAEQFISSHWTNPITITLTFDAMAWGPAAGTGGANPVYVNVSYTALRTALAAHANNPDAQAAVATLPATDPTVSYAGNHLWSLPQAYARMLGLSSQGGADGLITLNTTYTWSFGYGWSYGQDVIDAIEEWITEAMGRDGGLGDTLRPPGFDTYWSTLDLFRWSPAHLRDFTDGRDGQTTYFSVDGNTLLLPFFNLYSFGTFLGYPRDLILVHDFDAPDVFGHVQPSNAFVFSPTDYKVMNALGWTPVTFTAGPLMVSASGDFDGNGIPDLIWRGTNHIGMWSYNGSMVSTTDLGAFDFNWAVLGSGFFTFGTTTKQMLMDYVPSGLMTIWWVNNGQLTGINLGQKWVNVGYVATGAFVSTANRGGGGITDFLVSNLTDHHLYDWWIGSDSTLQGIDLGPVWSNVSVVATGQFKFNPNNLQHLLVSNTLDHHLYDWWIDSNNTLQGIDLGPVWSNVNFVSIGPTRNSQDSFLVANTVDHHLYDWVDRLQQRADGNRSRPGLVQRPARRHRPLQRQRPFGNTGAEYGRSSPL